MQVSECIYTKPHRPIRICNRFAMSHTLHLQTQTQTSTAHNVNVCVCYYYIRQASSNRNYCRTWNVWALLVVVRVVRLRMVCVFYAIFCSDLLVCANETRTTAYNTATGICSIITISERYAVQTVGVVVVSSLFHASSVFISTVGLCVYVYLCRSMVPTYIFAE